MNKLIVKQGIEYLKKAFENMQFNIIVANIIQLAE